MKKLMYSIFIVVASFVFVFMAYAAGNGHKGNQSKQHQYYNNQDRNDHEYYNKNYSKDRDDYRGRKGYSDHYNNYRYNNYYNDMHTYHGHFRNQSEWESYYRHHPEYAHHGHYEYRDGIRFFIFNDGNIGFSFSIGN